MVFCRRRWVCWAALIFLILAAAACARPKESAQDVQNRILKVAHTATVTTWDPSAAFSTEVTYLTNIYEPLIWANPPGSKEAFRPALATSWAASPDGLVWTFNLRKGVKFHDGQPFNAAAVKYSIERTKNMKKGASFIWAPVKSIEVVDDYTVKFVLKDPVPLERIVSSGNGAWMISPATAGKDAAWWEEGHEAGTGPWALESYKAGEQVVLARFKDYWGGWKQGQFDKVVVRIVREAVTQRQMVESGEVDIAGVVPAESLDALEKNPNLVVKRFSSFTNFVGFFNTRKPPLDNKLVRQALSYAIPYGDIIKVGANGLGSQARGPVPKGLWPGDDSLPQYTYDLEKAKELLTKAGYPKGGFSLTLTYASENPAEERFVPLLKESLAKLGIEVKISPMLWNQQWAMGKGDPVKAQDIFVLMWWPTYTDGYDNLSSMFTTEEKPAWNLAYWYNKEYDQLLAQAYKLSGTNVAESKSLYLQAQRLLIDEAPAIFFYDAMDSLTMSKQVQGFVPNASYPKVIFFYDLYR